MAGIHHSVTAWVMMLGLVCVAGCSRSVSIRETSVGSAASNGQSGTYKLVWSDEFNGSVIDRGNWSFEHGTSNDNWPKYWGNNELEYYTDRPENVYVKDGNLVITARKEDYNGMHYTSARLKTAPFHSWLYGKFEARIKLPVGKGIWPAFWMMPASNSYGPWPQSGEIDIMECIGDRPSTVYGTVHYGIINSQKGGQYTLKDSTFNDHYHTFTLVWEPDHIAWFVDGVQYYEVQKSEVPAGEWPFDRYFYVILNLAVGGDWPGNPGASTVFPQQMKVDYVRVYQK